MIGQTLGHYKILEKLGEGGMGEVFRAEDTTLDREVALKVLPAELSDDADRLARFEREAKTLAALDHPNIVTIHTVEESEGTRFLTMQLVEGRQLSELIPSGGMPLERIFDIAIPLADALATAHEKGVIHRDLKPANVMVTDEGRVKVLDFGLAKLRSELGAGSLATAMPTEPLTEEGRIVGTMPYMSPEQLEGGDLDERSDIFSLGIVLYEMASGERPFKGETSVSLISSIVKDSPQPVDTLRDGLPHHLGRVVGRCLEKNPERRYQTAKDVRNELEALAKETESDVVARTSGATIPAAAPPKRFRQWPLAVGIAIALLALGLLWIGRWEQPAEEVSEPTLVDDSGEPMIVVLPFENLGPPEDEYFADGMTEEITSRLAMVSGLGVISRTSAMQYKENRPALKQIGEELGVDYVLEGTIRWAKGTGGPDRVRITPQLIRVVDDRHLWADNIEKELEDIFAVQAEIAQRIVQELGVTLPGREQEALDQRPTENPAAYQAYLRGIDARWRADSGEAERLFGQAVEVDPRFAEAWAVLSQTLTRRHFNGEGSTDTLDRSAQALARARELAGSSPKVRFAEAVYHYQGRRDYEQAEPIVARLLDEQPSDAQSWLMLGAIHRRQGRWDEAVTELERTVELSPRDEYLIWELASTYWTVGRFEEADRMYEKGIAQGPEFGGNYTYRAWMQVYWQGDTEAGRQILARGPVYNWPIWVGGFLDYLDRDYTGALSRLESLVEPVGTVERTFFASESVWLHAAGDGDGARAAAARLRPKFEEYVRERPEDSILAATLSQLLAIDGDTESALRMAKRSEELVQNDALWRGEVGVMLAATYLISSRHDRALDLLEQSQSSFGRKVATPAYLRLDPIWDPLRDHPRFQALLEKHRQSEG